MTAHQYGYTKEYLTRDAKPWLPVMGEFHYTRYPETEWKQEVYKMKSMGVDIISTYVFWIHHEEEEGLFRFDGCRDLRAFLQVCRDADMPVWLRLGPWCHGECRNGGFPDWLMQKGCKLRDTNEAYMGCVKRLWEQVYAQVKAHLYACGGPIIGIQIENEYGHCGGDGGNEHMNALRALAEDIGFAAPYWTATGWGGAYIGNMLPVMGCYCNPPWERQLKPLLPNASFVFSHERNDADIGSDFARGEHVTFDEDAYPFLLAEMAGAVGAYFHRRPVYSTADTAAMSWVKLGSGANMLGYYMYHGGTNPGNDLNETLESGSYCEVPVLSYCAQAPVGDHGQIRERGKAVKSLAMFVHVFGEHLAACPAVIPDDSAKVPSDGISPRYALRMKDGSGFVFFSNYQQGMPMERKHVSLPVLGNIVLEKDAYGAYPVNMPIGSAVLRRAEAVPLCVLNGRDYVFSAPGGNARYDLEGDMGDCRIITLTPEEALNAWKVRTDKGERLIISHAPVITDDRGSYLMSREDTEWYDALDREKRHLVPVPDGKSTVCCTRVSYNYQCFEYQLDIACHTAADKTYLRIEYDGSIGEIYLDGVRIADNIYDGLPWETELTRFGRPQKLILRLYAQFEGQKIWNQLPPRFDEFGRALKLKQIRTVDEYHIYTDFV